MVLRRHAGAVFVLCPGKTNAPAHFLAAGQRRSRKLRTIITFIVALLIGAAGVYYYSQGQLKGLESAKAAVETQLGDMKTQLEKAATDLTASVAKLTESEAAVAERSKTAEDLQAKVTELEAKIVALEAELAAAKAAAGQATQQ
jgi:uncharacterized protein YlxW (UPF0749 family)